MASIRRRESARGDAAFAVLFRAYGKQTSETFSGPDAEQLAVKFKKLVERIGGEAADEVRSTTADTGLSTVSTPTVAELVAQHIDSLSGIEEGTRSDYRSYLRLSIKPTVLGKLPCDLPTSDHVAGWVNELAKSYSAKSIKNRHALLSAAFKRAVKKGYRPDNPAEGAKIPRSEVAQSVFLTHGEFAILLGHVPTYWQPLIAILAGTGMRWGEATALQVQDVHLDDTPPRLTISRAWKHTDGHGWRLAGPKTNRGRRTIGLNPSLVRVLRPLVENREAGEFVFTNTRGNPGRHNTFHEMVWTPAVKRATATKDQAGNEIPPEMRLTKHPTPHDLRHSHASWLIAQGVNLTEIQYRLGHESITTTSDRYGHLLPGHLDRSAAAIEVAMAQALPELEPAD